METQSHYQMYLSFGNCLVPVTILYKTLQWRKSPNNSRSCINVNVLHGRDCMHRKRSANMHTLPIGY